MNGFYKGFKFLYFSINRGIIAPTLPKTAISYMDLTYVIDGELKYCIDGEAVTLRSGDAIAFPPGSVRHRYESEAPVSYSSFNVMLPRDFEVNVTGKVEKAMRSNTLLMLESARKDYRSIGAYKNEKCLSVFLYLYHQLRETAEDKENAHVGRIKRFISERLSEPITLQAIAGEVHLVPRYVCTLFKEHTGLTLTDYITAERIDLAKRLIIAREAPLFEIAEECGFTDYNYFSRVFKRITKVSAKEYRKGAKGI